jgi:hypothetical protein
VIFVNKDKVKPSVLPPREIALIASISGEAEVILVDVE